MVDFVVDVVFDGIWWLIKSLFRGCVKGIKALFGTSKNEGIVSDGK